MKQLIVIEEFQKIVGYKGLIIKSLKEFDPSIQIFNENKDELFLIHSIDQTSVMNKVRWELSWYGIQFKTINENTFQIL